MKIYLSADIEGVCGITDWSEADRGHAAYSEFCERMTDEVVAACEGALEAGATEILVNDAHASGRNLLAEQLPREARLLRGWSGHPSCMVQEIDDSFDAALFVGWHSAASRGGNPLAHTLSSSKIAAITVNDEVVSEFHIHARAAALVSVPVVFVSGDEDLCVEVGAYEKRIETVGVTRGIGASTISMHPAKAREAIRAGVGRALAGDTGKLLCPLPKYFQVEVRFKDARDAYQQSFYPGAHLESPTSIVFESDDWFEVLRLFQFVC